MQIISSSKQYPFQNVKQGRKCGQELGLYLVGANANNNVLTGLYFCGPKRRALRRKLMITLYFTYIDCQWRPFSLVY